MSLEISSRRFRVFAIRAILTAAILTALFLWLPIAQLWKAMTAVGWPLWSLALFAILAGHVVVAAKWRLLLGACDVVVSGSRAIQAHATGLFASIWLPSLVGGDVVRAGLIVRQGGDLAGVVTGSLADRLIDTAGLVSLAAMGMVISSAAWNGLAPKVITATSVIVLLAVVVAPVALRRIDPDRLPRRVSRITIRLQAAVAKISQRPVRTLAAFALTLIVQSLFIVINARLGSAIGIDLPLSAWFAAWPLAKLSAMLPVSLGGLGVREVALATLLGPFGIAPTLAVAQSLLWQTVMLSLGLVAGGLTLATSRPGTSLPDDLTASTLR